MPIYNNPALGQAFNNIAQMFAPPSGSDLHGYAKANTEKEKAAQLSLQNGIINKLSADPRYAGFDHQSILADLYDPTQSFRKVEMDDATSQRAQDITATTLRATNAADNARALQTNSADNLRAIEDRRMQEAAAMERLGVTDATARYGVDTVAKTALTNNTADNDRALVEAAMGAATAPVVQGAIRPGFKPADYGVAAPAVPEFAGRVAPLNEAEQKAAERQRLAGSGQLTDQMLIDTIIGSDAPVQTVDASGNARYMSPGAAVREGATPYKAPSGATETQNYRTPDGVTGTAFFDPAANTWKDTATQSPIPQGAITFSSSLQGGADETGLAPTTANQTEGNKMEATLAGADADADALLRLLATNPGIAGMPGDIRGAAQNVVSVVGEMSQAFGNLAPEAVVTADQAQAALRSIAPSRDPAIQQYRTGIANLAYKNAQMNNPGGEVSRQAYERALESLQGGLLANNYSATEALTALKSQIERTRATQLRTLRNPGKTSPALAPPSPPSAENDITATNPQTGERMRVINGQWVPIP